MPFTETGPEPDVEVTFDEVWPDTKDAVFQWNKRQHVLSGVLRIVPKDVGIEALGRMGGRYRFMIDGCVRTGFTIDGFKRELDARTGHMLVIAKRKNYDLRR